MSFLSPSLASSGADEVPTDVVRAEDYTALAELAIASTSSATGWNRNNPVSGSTVSVSSGAVTVHQFADRGQQVSGLTKFWYSDASATNVGNYRNFKVQISFDDTIDGFTSSPLTISDDGTKYRWRYVFYDDEDLAGNVVGSSEIITLRDSLEYVDVYGRFTGTSFKSHGIEQLDPVAGVGDHDRIQWLIKDPVFVAANEAVVAGETEGAKTDPSVVEIGPNDTITGDDEHYTNLDESGIEAQVVDWRPGYSFNSFRAHNKISRRWDESKRNGTTEMYGRLQALFDQATEGDTLEFDPEDRLLVNTAQALRLSKRDITLAFQGAKILKKTDDTNAVLEITGQGYKIYDVRGFGYLSYTESSTNGNLSTPNARVDGQYWEAEGGASVSTTTMTLPSNTDASRTGMWSLTSNNLPTAKNGSASNLATLGGLFARDDEGWNTWNLWLSGDGSVVSITFEDQAGTTLSGEFHPDGVTNDQNSNKENPNYITLTSTTTKYTIKWRAFDDTVHTYIKVTRDSGATTVVIHEGTVFGHCGTNNDTNNFIDVRARASNTLIRNAEVHGFNADAVHIIGGAVDTRVYDLYARVMGRQGVSGTNDIDSIWSRMRIIGAGRHCVDFEPQDSQFVTRPVLEHSQLYSGYLGAYAGIATDFLVRPKFVNVSMFNAHNVNKAFTGGGRFAVIDGLTLFNSIDRDNWSPVETGTIELSGSHMSIGVVDAFPSRAIVQYEPLDAVEGNNIVRYAGGSTVVDMAHTTIFTGQHGEIHSYDATTDRNNIPFPPLKIADTSLAGNWVGAFKTMTDQWETTFGVDTPIGMAPRYLGGLDMQQEGIRNARGLTYGALGRAKLGGYHSVGSGGNAPGSTAVAFTASQYNKSDILNNQFGGSDTIQLADDGGGGSGTLNDSTQYFYKVVVKHPNGGSLGTATAAAEQNVTTSAGTAANDHTITITVRDLKHRFNTGNLYENLIRSIRIWRGTSTGSYDRYVDFEMDRTSAIALLGGYWGNAPTFDDLGGTIKINGTAGTDFSGVPNVTETWVTSSVPSATDNLTGEEPDALYIPICMTTADIGYQWVTNIATTGFTFNWSGGATAAFDFGYLLLGRDA